MDVSMLNPKLENRNSGDAIEINRSPFSIGRGLFCNYVIASKTISRLHCTLEKEADAWYLVDKSTNGSYINGKLITSGKSSPLKHNDVITFSLDADICFSFKTEPSEQLDGISDEQLCTLADSVLNEVAIFQQETKNQLPTDNTAVPDALLDHFGMAKGNKPQPCKKQKLERTENIIKLDDKQDSDKPGSSTDNDKPGSSTGNAESKSLSSALELAQRDQYEVMENELQCAICSELFVRALTLNCSHTFCKYCIEMWKKNKMECPICRTKITGTTSTLVLDNVIEKVIETSSEDIKQRRKQVLEERGKLEAVKPRPPPATKAKPRRGRSSARTNAEPPRLNVLDPAAINIGALINNVIEVSSDSSADYDSSDTQSDEVPYWEDEYDCDDWYGGAYARRRGYYGGYGNCFSCGREGHWAPQCPYR